VASSKSSVPRRAEEWSEDKDNSTVSQVKDKVSSIGQNAIDKVDSARDSAATKLDSVVSSIHDKADNLPGGEKVSNMAHTAADKLSSTADYVREHDVKDMMSDVEDLVKANPGPSLLAALGLGFLVGRAFSRRD
jgi:ElaB/YqjD/DUF883 family membrane-anchored ribosome-binding protein